LARWRRSGWTPYRLGDRRGRSRGRLLERPGVAELPARSTRRRVSADQDACAPACRGDNRPGRPRDSGQRGPDRETAARAIERAWGAGRVGRKIELLLTQEELASWTGATRET